MLAFFSKTFLSFAVCFQNAIFDALKKKTALSSFLKRGRMQVTEVARYKKTDFKILFFTQILFHDCSADSKLWSRGRLQAL